MFDGSHRSRRTIDLSGRHRRQRRKTTSSDNALSGSSAILEQARIQRSERRQIQRNHAAAKSIQRIYRGRQARKRLAVELASTATTEIVVSMRLSAPLLPYLPTSVSHVLLEYYNDSKTTTQQQQQQDFKFSKKRIFQTALRELRPSKSSSELLPLVVHLLQSTRGMDIECFVSLISCCQEWLWSSSQNDTTTTASTLWLRSCRLASTFDGEMNASLVIALLACTVFCTTKNGDLLQQGLREASGIFPNSNDGSALQWYQTTLLPPLVNRLTTTHSDMSNNVTGVAVLKAIHGRECILLENALNLWKHGGSLSPSLILNLLDLVFAKRSDLAFLVSLVVRGEDVQALLLSHSQTRSVAVDCNDDDRMDESEDDDVVIEMEEQQRIQPKSGTTKHRPLQRRDLQTVPKLDRLYQELVMTKVRKQVLADLETASDKELIVGLATQLGDANLWLELGNAIFEKNGPQEARGTFVTLLFSLLQCTTGLRTTKSPFLSQLAFHRGLRILEGLWQSVVEWVDNNMLPEQDQQLLVTAGMTVFSDLFAHHLLVLHDEEFLRYYTASGGAHGKKRLILAEDVIARLGGALHDVYWSKPVVAADLSNIPVPAMEERLKCHRGRLLLSGTKLWNSLYERWCRLVRHAPTFCNESQWWFPNLMIRDSDGVVNVRSQDDDDGGTMDMDIDDDESDHDHAPSAAEEQSDALAEIFRDPKMARILTCIPQALPFERRVKMFSSLLLVDKQTTQDEESEFRRAMLMMMARNDDDEDANFGGRERVEIRRDALYDDSMNQLNQLGSRLKKRVQVTFINQHGATEAGIDGGGVFKEFLDDLIKEAFDPSNDVNRAGAPKLFSVTPLQTLSVNASASYDLSHYEFLGRVLGKAVYESILVEPQFCLPFLNQLLGKQNTLDDLKNFDAEYYNNLIKLRNMDAKALDGLGLTFELTTTLSGDDAKTPTTRELMPGGSNVAVTKQNVIQYVHLVAHQRLNVDGAAQTKAFLKGFRDLIPASWLRLFSSNELQKLISGDDTFRGIDVGGMKAATRYSGGYHRSQPIIGWLWEVVEEMTPDQQRQFLRFMTSCSRQPLLGFQALEPPPCIQQLRLDDGLFDMHDNNIEALSKVTPLPTSATCMNLLKLPNYRSKELLKKKLLDAIESGAGFELT